MKYCFYLRLKIQDGNWIKVGESHEIDWDNRDIIKASSGWLIVNQDEMGIASEFIPKLYKGICELTYSPDSYTDFELNHGLGTIKNILDFYEGLLRDCRQYPYTELCGHIAE